MKSKKLFLMLITLNLFIVLSACEEMRQYVYTDVSYENMYLYYYEYDNLIIMDLDELAPMTFLYSNEVWIHQYFLIDNRPITMGKFLNQYDSYITFNEFDEWCRSYTWIAFISNVPLFNFSYATIDHEVRQYYNYYYEQYILFSIDILPPETPVLFAWRNDSITANRGIVFERELGEIGRYVIIPNEAGDDIPHLHVKSLVIFNVR